MADTDLPAPEAPIPGSEPNSQGETKHDEGADTVMLGFRVPKETKRQFHAVCVSQGSDMTTVLLDFVVEYVKKGKALGIIILAMLAITIQDTTAQVIDTEGPTIGDGYSVEVTPRLKEILAPLQPQARSTKPAETLPEASVATRTIGSNSDTVVHVAPQVYSINGINLQMTDKVKRMQVQLTPTDYIMVDVPIFVYVVREQTSASPEDIAFLEGLYEKVAAAASFTTGSNDKFHSILQDLKQFTDKKKKPAGT